MPARRPHRATVASLALIVIALTLWVAPAQAAFPGANGRLAMLHQPANFLIDVEGWTINPNGSDVRTVVPTGLGPGGGTTDVQAPMRYSPDGTRVVYSWMPGLCGVRSHRGMVLRIANADGTGVRNLTQNLCGTALNGAVTIVNDDLDPGWSPDGARVVFTSRRGCLKQQDPQCDNKTEIWSLRASDGQDLRQLTAGPNDHGPTWGTNGRIAFTRNGDIWTMNANGSGQTQITSGPGDDTEPNWSPDAQRLVFSSNRDEPGADCIPTPYRCHYDIYSMNANGTGITRLNSRPGKQDMAPVFSPDGRKIAWNGDGDYAVDVWTMNADGSEPTNVTNAARPGSPFVFDFNNFSGIYSQPDWQALSGIPPALPAMALRNQNDSPDTYAGQPPVTGTVYIGQRAPAGGTVVSLSSSHPSLASVPASVTIPAGRQSATYSIRLIIPAATTTATITATIPGRSATTSIDLHPAPSDVNFFISPSDVTSVKAGQVVQIGANLNTAAGPGGAVVSFTSSHPAVAPVPATQSYAVGTSSGGFTVHTGAVSAPTVVTLTARFGTVTRTLSFTVTPGPQLTSLTLVQPSIAGPGAVAGNITLSEGAAPFETLRVALSSSNTAVATVPPDVSTTTATASFPVTVKQVATRQTVTITGTFAGQTRSATLTVDPPGAAATPTLSGLAFAPASVRGGTSSTGTVSLTSAAPTGGVAVSLSSPNTAVRVPANVTVAAGQTTATFTATTTAVTASTPVDVTASATGSPNAVGRLTLTPPPPPSADTVTVTRAEYDAAKRSLRVEATGSNATATLTAFADASSARLGALQNAGGGQYRGQFDGVDNPGTVRVTSSLGGSATRVVTGASGTVKVAPAAPTPATQTTATSKTLVAPALRATAQITLPAADPADATMPTIERLRLLPRRFRATTGRGTLVSFTLSEPAKVALSFARQHRARFAAVPGSLLRTLPTGRVRVRFDGTLGGGRVLRPGVYRVTVSATDASGNTGAPARAMVFVRP